MQFPLHPNIPDGGIEIARLFRGNEAYVAAARRRLGEVAAREGLPLGDLSRTYNSRLAQELSKLGEAEGIPGIHSALFRAYFVDDRNIGSVDELVAIAHSVGLDPEAARRALESGEHAAAVDADWQRARGLGVTGVPTFLADDRAIVGFQPYELLEKLVQVAGGERRATSPAPAGNADTSER